ncbi:permease [Gryllotalpicola ginsengisoli]|uniref:permease n=1 Tax=Gryllotalpicola ginsengisoli TaxID=444608 RepID=UPI0003B5ABB2|nr:permease [Gryllotalpicola ginsengisoli]
MHFLSMLGESLWSGFSMFWETLWALVLGFALSGAVQAFVSRERMQRSLGDHRPKTIAKASLWGVVSSSCSYAASALAKTLFSRGADFSTSLVFMIASTNLVVELGLVLWLLMGWQFALAEFVGGAIMIALIGWLGPRFLPDPVAHEARERASSGAGGGHEHMHGGHDHEHMHGETDGHDEEPLARRIRSRRGWSDAAAYMISDLTMLRKELVIGFLVAGILAVFVPTAVWQSVFVTGHGFWSSLENVLVGPFLAMIAFVCSVGNVPLAATLWHGGASFGGVVAFVFADLITVPLLLIYRRYYGGRVTLRILGLFWLSMSAAGLAVEYLFRLVRLPEPSHDVTMEMRHISWNYTTWLDIAALAVFALLYWLYRTRGASERYAKDPVCGMQVEVAHAPASRTRDGRTYYFCSDRCAARFDREHRGAAHDGQEHDQEGHQHMHEHGNEASVDGATAIDPVCKMTVDIATAPASAEHEGRTYYFCNPGCRTAFLANPEAFLTESR